MTHKLSKTLSGILLVPVLAIGVFFVAPQKADAQVPTIELPGSVLVEAALGQIAKEGSPITGGFSLDAVAYLLADVALEVMTADIISWINSGFEGSPAFVSNPSAFLGDVADYAAGAFIEDIGAGFLCSAFDVDIRAAIELNYYQATGGDGSLRDKYQCTLSDIEGNVDDFLSDFREGDLEDFFAISLEPSNNPYAVLNNLSIELDARTRDAEREAELTVFEAGDGFLSHRECRTYTDDDGQQVTEEPPNCSGDILTPGSIIENQLGDVLSIGQNRLTVADEFNEIASAFLVQVVRQALGSAGLAAAGGSSNSSGGGDVNTGQRRQLEQQLEQNIENGDALIDVISDLLADLARAEGEIETALRTCESGTLEAALRDVRTQQGQLEEERDKIITALPTLRRLQREIREAEGQGALANIASQYQQLVQEGGVISGAERNGFEQNAVAISATVEEYITQAENCD